MVRISTLNLWRFVFISAIADIITTYVGIHIFSLTETNPILFTDGGIAFVLTMFSLKGIVIIISYLFAYIYEEYEVVIPAILATIWSLVSIWNLFLIMSLLL